ncbi:MAG TPA: Flp family type IVb pilin [Tepidisphaeraceae bacterium]|nr:Flp family type IVb pilin [Tepidisphaeraceae bacterium]
MSSFKNLFMRLWHDETGGEVVEYAVITGLIVMGCIGVMRKVGAKVLARWNSLNSSL